MILPPEVPFMEAFKEAIKVREGVPHVTV
jgi:hypothetical protein